MLKKFLFLHLFLQLCLLVISIFYFSQNSFIILAVFQIFCLLFWSIFHAVRVFIFKYEKDRLSLLLNLVGFGCALAGFLGIIISIHNNQNRLWLIFLFTIWNIFILFLETTHIGVLNKVSSDIKRGKVKIKNNLFGYFSIFLLYIVYLFCLVAMFFSGYGNYMNSTEYLSGHEFESKNLESNTRFLFGATEFILFSLLILLGLILLIGWILNQLLKDF